MVEDARHVTAAVPGSAGSRIFDTVADFAGEDGFVAVQPCQNFLGECRYIYVSVEAIVDVTFKIGIAVAAHMPMVNGVLFGENDGGGVRPILEQGAVFPEQAVEFSTIVMAQAAPQNEVLWALNDADGIKL